MCYRSSVGPWVTNMGAFNRQRKSSLAVLNYQPTDKSVLSFLKTDYLFCCARNKIYSSSSTSDPIHSSDDAARCRLNDPTFNPLSHRWRAVNGGDNQECFGLRGGIGSENVTVVNSPTLLGPGYERLSVWTNAVTHKSKQSMLKSRIFAFLARSHHKPGVKVLAR